MNKKVLRFKRIFALGIICVFFSSSFSYGGPKPKPRRAKSAHSRSYHLRQKSKKPAKQSPTQHSSTEAAARQTIAQTVQRQVVSSTPVSRPVSSSVTKERPPIWAMYGGSSSSTGIHVMNGGRRSTASLRLELSERGILPQNWQEYTNDQLQEFLDTYLALKSSGERTSRFRKRQEDGTLEKKTDAELKEWAHNQPDWKDGRNFIFKTYQRPFNAGVKSLRVLVVNDHQQPLQPLLDVVAEYPGVEIYWESSGKKLAKELNDYDVILTDYCLLDGSTAVDLGMSAYEAGVTTPIVFYAGTGATPEWLFQFNLAGRIDMAKTRDAARRVINYLSDLVMDEVQPDPTN